jgi:NitT/TauT family transport system substrate-binding protein
MFKLMHRVSLVVLAAVLAAIAVSCVPAKPEEPKLKLALIPVLDTIPIFIAQQNGYFAEQGITVETIPVKSPQERDVLVTTGQVDGVLTDLQSVGLLNKDAPKLKAVYTSRHPFPNAPMFRILAGPKTAINAPADLKGVPIGISANTVMEYLTDRMLAGEGLKPEEIAKIEIGQIPVRFEQLMNGNIQAAALPDPLAQGAMAAGAKLIVDDSKYDDLSQSVLTFTTDTLNTKPATVKKFLVAWEKAVNELNAHPEKYQNVLIEQGRVPKSIQGSYTMPPFPGRGVPSEAEVKDVTVWLKAKGLVNRDIPYTDLVDASFLPK